jgi:hypothetical protein
VRAALAAVRRRARAWRSLERSWLRQAFISSQKVLKAEWKRVEKGE